MNKVIIIGAGLAGLLAGNMLRHRSTILEKQSGLPNNHHALLRFKTGVFGTVVGIPFKKVRMIKAVYGDNANPIANVLKYSFKTTGERRTDRSLPIGLISEERYIAPENLIAEMEAVCDVRYGIDDWQNAGTFKKDDPVISTIPMPQLMELLKYPKRKEVEFRSIKGSVISGVIDNCDAYATYYFPQADHSIYRASITGNTLILESTGDLDCERDESYAASMVTYYAKCFGLSSSNILGIQFHHMKYAKILPIDDDVRKDFMQWATFNHNIFSLGRYATWRPGLLLDDLVHDVNLISNWIVKGSKYNAAKHWV